MVMVLRERGSIGIVNEFGTVVWMSRKEARKAAFAIEQALNSKYSPDTWNRIEYALHEKRECDD